MKITTTFVVVRYLVALLFVSFYFIMNNNIRNVINSFFERRKIDINYYFSNDGTFLRY